VNDEGAGPWARPLSARYRSDYQVVPLQPPEPVWLQVRA